MGWFRSTSGFLWSVFKHHLAVIVVTCLLGAESTQAQKPLGIDVSQFQRDINWSQVYAGGRVFAFIRASHGAIQDTKFLSNMAGATGAGVVAGAYHYAVPVYDAAYGMPGADPETEATRFLNMARDYIRPGYLRPVLDIELGGGQVPVGANNLANWCNAWIDAVERQTGVEAIVYCNSYYARNYLRNGYPSLATKTLWIANWTHPSNPQTAYPTAGTDIWPTWQFWQYSNNGNSGYHSVPGVPTRVDLNIFNGTYAQLQNYVISRSAVITASPMSLTQEVRQRLNADSQNFTIRNTGTGGLIYRAIPDRTWLSVTPDTNFIKTNVDTITVNYATTDLPVGTHSATIALVGELASNSPQNVEITLTVRPIPGDLNSDGSIDGSDINIFLPCLTGADQGPPSPNCEAADFDTDGDVDQTDFALLQTCLSGTGLPADPLCMP